MDPETSITYLKGVGPGRGKLFESRGIRTVEDLLYYMPFRYEDRSNIKPIAMLQVGETATVVGEVIALSAYSPRRSKMRMFEVRIRDASGETLVCKWFRGGYQQSIFERGQTVAYYGTIEVDRYGREPQIVHPDYEIFDPNDPDAGLHTGRIVPVYRAPGKMTARVIRALVHHALQTVELGPDPLPQEVRRRLALPDRRAALGAAHFPPADTDYRLLTAYRTPAQFRLIFEEFFFLECGLALKRRKARAAKGIAFELNDRARQKIKKMLPFKPTGAQKRVLKEIVDDMAAPTPMNRLLQGDVGSGKTIVAAEACVVAVENGYQAAVMAPTEILADQHYFSFKRLFEPIGYNVVPLSGSQRKREKDKVKRLISEGVANIAVGTHALISEGVDFKNLGLIVIDEQHRFGVLQRLGLLRKGEHPDVLVMTATPIPRTLSLTLYGELDVSIIDELPPGRTPIVTRSRSYEQIERVYSFLKQEVTGGRQAYVVCPLVEESELKTASAAEKVYEHLSQTVFPDLRVAMLHGRMSPADKEAAMEGFKSGATQILVSTTVIEVGVDVPNATVMVVEHSENFGLSQLHQLRGRVGRGAAKSYCVLLTENPSATALERIRTMERTNDGFEIAETDLQLRGPGEFFGVKQSGLPEFRVANLLRDREALELARSEATAIVESPDDPAVLPPLVEYIRGKWQRRYGLVQVG